MLLLGPTRQLGTAEYVLRKKIHLSTHCDDYKYLLTLIENMSWNQLFSNFYIIRNRYFHEIIAKKCASLSNFHFPHCAFQTRLFSINEMKW